MKIKQVVEESWEELLKCSKDLQDAKLEDGEKYFNDKESALQNHLSCIFRSYSQNAIGLFNFSSRTETCEKQIFDAVKDMMTKLPPAEDGNFIKDT